MSPAVRADEVGSVEKGPLSAILAALARDAARPRLRPDSRTPGGAALVPLRESPALRGAGREVRGAPRQAGASPGSAGAAPAAPAGRGALRPPQPRSVRHRRRPLAR